MGVRTVNDPPYNAVGDGVADDTVPIQQALDAGFALLAPNNGITGGLYRTTSTLSVPYSSTLKGSSRTASIIIPDSVVGPAIQTTPFENEQTIENIQIAGQADVALQVKDSNIVKLESIRIGRDGTSQPFLTQPVFTTGVTFKECFSSSMNNIVVVGTQITDFCCHITGAFNGNTMSNFQTSTFCQANLRIDNSEAGQNAGSNLDTIVMQGGNRGLDLQNATGFSISSVYTENVGLPIVIGSDDGVLRTVACNLSGLFLIGPNGAHPDFANRTAHIVINNVTAITIENAFLVSYDSEPRLDGIWYDEPTNSVISGIHGPAALFVPREQLIKRFVNAGPLAGFRLDSTDEAGRQTEVIKSRDTNFGYEIREYASGGLTTTPFTPNYAVQPPMGHQNLTEHADVTAYVLNEDFVYVGTAAVDGNVYKCVTSGTSGTGTPPTGTGTGIVDGTVVWDFHGVLV